MNPQFPLGQVVATRGVSNQVPQSQILAALRRHAAADWGIVCPEDAKANDQALANGTRVLSAYETESGHKIWIITEADRSATTVLFPDEY